MSDIYLQITETPTVVTLSAPVISGALSSTVTVANVVSVNVVTMPSISVQAPSVTTVIGTVTVGNSVTIGSLPAISGTVTANALGVSNLPLQVAESLISFDGGRRLGVAIIDSTGSEYSNAAPFPVYFTNSIPAGAARIGVVTIGGGTVTIGAGTAQIGSVTVGNSVTIGSLPAISGTVTANLGNVAGIPLDNFPSHAVRIGWGSEDVLRSAGVDAGGEPLPIQIHLGNSSGDNVTTANPLPISGTVTIGSLPAISGTVTANSSNGSLTTRFGSVTTANTAFETSAVTNANRKYLLIQNITTASNVITVGIGFTPTTTQGIQLFAGAGLTFEGSYIPTGAVNLLSSVTASCFTILEA